MSLLPLEDLLNILCTGTGLHICVHDISGLLAQTDLALPFSYKNHKTPFCDTAKLTSAGLELCMRCKERANKKAVRLAEPFDGFCAFGLYELSYPIVLDGAVRCILYIGHISVPSEQAPKKLHRACRLTGADSVQLLQHLKTTQPYINRNHYLSIARLTEEHIRLLYKSGGSKTTDCHWAVKNICHDIETQFSGDLTLKREAQLYFLNEKYIGRIFRRETGKSFHQYLNQIRLRHAQSLLEETNFSILEIALACGFQNVTYFNRIFKQKLGKTPSAYRKTKLSEADK